MCAFKVGVREFRAGLADFIDSDEPVAVTRARAHGRLLHPGQDSPGRTPPPEGGRGELRRLLHAGDDEVEAMVEDYKARRKARL